MGEIKKSCWGVTVDGDNLRSDGFSALVPGLLREGVMVFVFKKWTDRLNALMPYLFMQSFEVPIEAMDALQEKTYNEHALRVAGLEKAGTHEKKIFKARFVLAVRRQVIEGV